MVRQEENTHATCVALSGQGVLLRGASGIGKSDLGLRLIDTGAVLVADDRVCLTVERGDLIARPPERLAGLVEVRGLGLMRMAHLPACPVRLVVDLYREEVPRLQGIGVVELCSLELPAIALDAFPASAPVVVRHALAAALEPDRLSWE